MIIRRYLPTDCKEIITLFYNTVHSVNAKDYTKKQLDVWATGKENLNDWNKSLLNHYTLVATIAGVIVGFGDIDKSGYLDRLFVHKDYQQKGIGSVLCNELEKISPNKITVHASITAKPFFLKRNYTMIKKQEVIRQNISLTNFFMEKSL